jgi:hypothetical protein
LGARQAVARRAHKVQRIGVDSRDLVRPPTVSDLRDERALPTYIKDAFLFMLKKKVGYGAQFVNQAHVPNLIKRFATSSKTATDAF